MEHFHREEAVLAGIVQKLTRIQGKGDAEAEAAQG
jgi:hypothetical protein